GDRVRVVQRVPAGGLRGVAAARQLPLLSHQRLVRALLTVGGHGVLLGWLGGRVVSTPVWPIRPPPVGATGPVSPGSSAWRPRRGPGRGARWRCPRRCRRGLPASAR